eukprot:TRINITY_DN3252_c0_g2_i5.p1 TRINITY_DN3252_c0_g2~~TRINITY_DN3252_c0_g2_i5.p1  ORF type:complete len:133 (+),score=15.94 TRINITY_DN3252_c0_g2_i5:153-551(+)
MKPSLLVTGYVISHKAMQLLQNAPCLTQNLTMFEDVNVGMCFAQLGIPLRHVDGFFTESLARNHPNGFGKRLYVTFPFAVNGIPVRPISLHHASFEEIWSWEHFLHADEYQVLDRMIIIPPDHPDNQTVVIL